MAFSYNRKFFSGTSGVVLPVQNKQALPADFQDKSRLSYYASIFNSVEINSSFYKVPMASTVKKWTESVPEGFQFTFKVWKEITHVKGFEFKPDDIYHFMQAILPCANKGCLLVQLPPKLTIASISQLENLLSLIKSIDTQNHWKLAVEYRNKSWYHEETYDLLNGYNAGIVIHDIPASGTSLLLTDANFVYLRFHGPTGNYRGGYSEDFLYEYAQYIKEWNSEDKSVYVYFNNTMGDAIKDLKMLNSFVNV